MTTWSWIRLTGGLWLLRRAAKGAGWLLAFAVLIAAWPLTLIVLAGYLAACWRGWPAVRLRRAAVWALTGTALWLLAQVIYHHAWQAAALTAVRTWEPGWPPRLAPLTAARAFLLLAPAMIPAGLGLPAVGPRRQDSGRRHHPHRRAPLGPRVQPSGDGTHPAHGDRRRYR